VGKQTWKDDEVSLFFTVTDTGIGIPAEKQRVIFDAFSQASDSMTRLYGGSGLGLTITSRLVDMMGGRIRVESEVGRGSSFHFTARFGLAQGPVTQPVPVPPDSLRDLRVLVVDDNGTNRRILEEMLEGWQMRPTSTHSGQSALAEMERAAAAREPYPLVILDSHMPGMDGFALAERIKDNPALTGATIMMLTSADRHGDATRARELGIAAYMMKPITQADLWNSITKALGGMPADALPSLPTPADRQPEQMPRRILLAEDNLVNQKVAARVLERGGHQVVVVGDGNQALTALEAGQFDLVLMDVQMPDMDGFEATAAIREREKTTLDHIPIIAMTAYAMKGDRERCLEAGMDDYVSKPVRAKELIEAVGSLLPSPGSEGVGSQLNGSDPIDSEAVLERFGGDGRLLREVIDIFLEDCPKSLQKVRAAVSTGDTAALEGAAHSIKGSVGVFEDGPALAAAQTLEEMGRDGDLTDAQEASAILEAEAARLQRVLEGIRDGEQWKS
jgi:CheY-like chemotaxis protein/HPt (histidine-containing phosphotransfer) domain-containing protein